jgi:hypothetical protein
MSFQINEGGMAEIHGDYMRRVDAAAQVVKNEMVRLLTLNDGASMRTLVDKTTGRKRKRLKYGVRRSKPGESPYKQTGMLSQSVAIERRPEDLTCRIGDGVFYGAILELALDRPHMRLALDNKLEDVVRILGG